MTSAHSMLKVLIVGALAVSVISCGPRRDRLDVPRVIVSPYDTRNGEVLWAVIPPRNESGVSLVREDMIGDAIVAAVQGVRGVRCLPINRSLEAMRVTGIREVTSTNEAMQLANTLGVDGIVVGSITAYDPYNPPVLGLALAVYAQPGAMEPEQDLSLDPFALSMAFTDYGRFDSTKFAGDPVSAVSEHLDARDHAVLMDLQRFARGRSDNNSALRWRVYTASMELYTRFVAHHTVGRLIEHEWIRAQDLSRAR